MSFIDTLAKSISTNNVGKNAYTAPANLAVTNKVSVTPAAPTTSFGPLKNPTTTPTTTFGPLKVPTASTTTISNANKINEVPKIIDTTKKLADTGTKTDANGNATYSNGTVVVQPDYDPMTGMLTDSGRAKGLQEQNVKTNTSGITAKGGYLGETYYAPGSTVPKGPDGKTLTLTDESPQNNTILNNLMSLKATTDSHTASLIDNIHQQFTQLIAEQRQTNAGQEGITNNALLMGGATGQGSSAQYAPISSSGIIQTQVSYGLQQIANLQTKEATMIIAAQQAGDDANFQLMDSYNKQIASIRKEKNDAAIKLNETLLNESEKFAQDKKDAQDKIDAIALEAKKNGMPDINVITSSKSIGAAMQAAGSYLQSGTGDVANYLVYKRQTSEKGLTPMDYAEWQAKEDARKAKIESSKAYDTAYSTAKGKAAGTPDSGATTVDENGNIISTGNLSTLEIGRFNLAATRATKVFRDTMAFKAAQNADFYISKLKAANENVGSIGDQEILDSISQFNTGGGRVTEAQVNLILAGKSLPDTVNAWTNKVKNGGILSDSQRKQALKLATATAEEFIKNYEKKYTPLKEKLQKQGIPEEFWGIPSPEQLNGEIDTGTDSATKIDEYVLTNPGDAEMIAKLYEVPGATDADIYEYLKANKKIQ